MLAKARVLPIFQKQSQAEGLHSRIRRAAFPRLASRVACFNE